MTTAVVIAEVNGQTIVFPGEPSELLSFLEQLGIKARGVTSAILVPQLSPWLITALKHIQQVGPVQGIHEFTLEFCDAGGSADRASNFFRQAVSIFEAVNPQTM